MTQHTPGPWHLEHRQSIRNYYFVNTKGGSEVARVDASHFDSAGNARLIAKAPEMLALIHKIFTQSQGKCQLEARSLLREIEGA